MTNTCMVEVARFFMSFTQKRVLWKMRSVPGRYQADAGDSGADRGTAKAKWKIWISLEELAKMIQSMALCGLGKSAPLPVLSTSENIP